MARQNH
jgi:hypothetical protein